MSRWCVVVTSQVGEQAGLVGYQLDIRRLSAPKLVLVTSQVGQQVVLVGYQLDMRQPSWLHDLVKLVARPCQVGKEELGPVGYQLDQSVGLNIQRTCYSSFTTTYPCSLY